MSTDPRAEGSPSEARGSQSHPHPVAEGRQSPGLLPCPFCGGEAKLEWDNGVALVECTICRAASGRAPYANKAAAFWNRRALAAPGTPIEAAGEVTATRNVLETYCESLGLRKGMALWDLAYIVTDRLAHPAGTPIEKAAREVLAEMQWMITAVAMSRGTHDDPAVKDAEKVYAALESALSGLPPSPIEKAAREAVNARQILIQEARKHGRAYWANRRSCCAGHPWPLIHKERRYACLRALSFLNAARAAVDGSGLPQEQADESALGILRDLLAWMERRPIEKRDAAAISRVRVIIRRFEAQEPAPMDGGPIAPPPTTSGPVESRAVRCPGCDETAIAPGYCWNCGNKLAAEPAAGEGEP